MTPELGRAARSAILAAALAVHAAGAAAEPIEDGAGAWARMPETAFSLARAREGSGTAWLPEAGPSPGAFGRLRRLQGALRWSLLAGWTEEPGPRGDARAVGPGFVSLDVGRDLGAWRLSARATLSPEPWTIGAGGAPLLFRAGAVRDGAPLPDRTPPLPLVTELALVARLELTPALGVEAYGAAAGEPALGPPAITHRLSAAFEPAAPLAEDVLGPATASAGVVTAGVFGRRARLEASAFGARTPGADPVSPEAPRLDSASARLSVSISPALVAQASLGAVASPAEPGSDRRTSVSLSWTAPAGDRGAAAVTLAAGRADAGAAPRRAALVEAAFVGDRGAALFGRAEWAERTAAELGLGEMAPGRTFSLGRVSLGGSLPLARAGRAVLAAGVRGALALAPAALDGTYGRSPLAAATVFVQLRPALSRGGAYGGHRGEGWWDP